MYKERILIVEDEAIIAMEMEASLIALGYKVAAVVNTGKMAIDKAFELQPDIIIMDIRIKGEMDGIEAASEIRERFDIPVIFATAFLDEERIERAKIAMPFGYVLKPIQDRDLKVTIEMALYISKVDRDRKRAESRLQESEEKYRIAFETNSNCVTITRLNGLYVDVNPGFTELTGYTREEIIGVSSRQIGIWRYPEEREELLKQLKTVGGVKNMQATFRCKDGSLKVAILSASIIHLNEIPHILLFSRDITEQLSIEAELSASERKFRQIFENIPIPYIEVDLEGRIVEVSPSVEKHLKYRPEELIGTSILDLYNDSNKHDALLKELSEKGEIIGQEVEMKDKDGRILPLLAYFKLIPEKKVIISSLVVTSPIPGN